MDESERRVVLFLSGAHGLVHTYELSIPILMTVWLAVFSTSAVVLGTLVTVGYGLFGIGALPGGVLVDLFGSKPLIFASLAGMAGSFMLASLVPSLPALALAIGFWGVAASVYHPAGLSLISKAVDSRGMAYAYHGMGGTPVSLSARSSPHYSSSSSIGVLSLSRLPFLQSSCASTVSVPTLTLAQRGTTLLLTVVAKRTM